MLRLLEVLRRFDVLWEVWWSGAIFFGTLQLRGSRIRVVEWCVRIKGLLKRRRFEVLELLEVLRRRIEVWWSGAILKRLRGRSRIRVVEWCVRIKGLLKGLMVLRVRIQKYIPPVHILLMKIKSRKRLFRMSGEGLGGVT
jgi:hypothetical protein